MFQHLTGYAYIYSGFFEGWEMRVMQILSEYFFYGHKSLTKVYGSVHWAQVEVELFFMNVM